MEKSNDKKINIKKIINTSIGILISVVAVLIFVKGIDVTIFGKHILIEKLDIKQILSIIKNVDPFYLVLALIFSQIPFVFRARRVCDIIGYEKLSFKKSLHYNVLGFGMNNVFPARAGEFYKAYLIKKNANISMISSLGGLLIERIYDGFMMSVFFLGSVFVIENRILPDSAIMKILPVMKGISYLGLFGVVLAFCFVLIFRKSKRIPLVSQKISDFILKEISVIDSFLIKDNFKSYVSILSNSAMIWFFLGFGVHLLLLSFGVDVISIADSFFTEGVIGFSVALPQAPGYVGVFQIGTATALGSLGISVAEAQSVAIILWFIQIIPVALSFIFLFLIGKKG